jgi:hypothetical protein
MRQKQREGKKVISFDDVSWEILTEQTSKLRANFFLLHYFCGQLCEHLKLSRVEAWSDGLEDDF